MTDVIMTVSGYLFLVLFSFLLFIFIVFLLSFTRKKSFNEYRPGVSVLIPAYNEEKNIGSCIRAVLSADYPKDKVEIVVIDDGSTDSTAKVASSFESVIVVKGKHEGKSPALNLGLGHAKYDIILAVDADTVIDKKCIQELVNPLADEKIGATTGCSTVRNKHSPLGIFQNIEYHYNNLIRHSFSKFFDNGIWFFGALACYKKNILQKIGGFKKDTLTEDMDIALEIKQAGFTTINISKATGSTLAPGSLKELYNQRARWWMGVLQSLTKNRKILSKKASPSIWFLYINQFWWTIYAFFSLPLILYQVNYWLPYNLDSFVSLFGYLFRWFSLLGPIYVIYKIPEWGINFYSFFGVLSGIISTIMIISAIKLYKDRISLRNLFGIFFYFPYTIVLNMMILISVVRFRYTANKFFIR